MFTSIKYRIYPNKEQCVLLDKHFNAVRFVYNLALETKTMAYASNGSTLSRYDLQSQLKDLKSECNWLKEVNSQSLQCSLMNLDVAYGKFFKGLSKFPKFKSKKSNQSFQCPQKVFIKANKLFLPKFKSGIEIVMSRPICGVAKMATVSKTPTSKYFVSFVIECEDQENKILSEEKVGIDLGLKTFATLSDGNIIENPRHLKHSLSRLKCLQRRVSRKSKGSHNRKKAVIKLALCHEKITNQRKDFLHKVTDSITKKYGTIVIEDLNVKGMVKNHKLAQSISDVGWGTFETFLRYKSSNRGNEIIQIGRFEPSSKMCGCGVINQDLKLSDRIWKCSSCGVDNDRDLLAARNILKFGLINKASKGIAGETVELPTLVGALKQ
jgi:putative transposase